MGESSTNGQLTIPPCTGRMCQFRTPGGGPAYARHALETVRRWNITPDRRRLRKQRGVEHLAVEHEPLRVQGALRLLHEKPRGRGRDGHEERRRPGADAELVRSGRDGQSGPDPRALAGLRSVTQAPA